MRMRAWPARPAPPAAHGLGAFALGVVPDLWLTANQPSEALL